MKTKIRLLRRSPRQPPVKITDHRVQPSWGGESIASERVVHVGLLGERLLEKQVEADRSAPAWRAGRRRAGGSSERAWSSVGQEQATRGMSEGLPRA